MTIKRLLITQRHDQVDGRDEWRDSLDIRWSYFSKSLGVLPILMPNGIEKIDLYLNELQPDFITLSGGNNIGSPVIRDEVEIEILNYAQKKLTPVVGVCRGMQFLNYYFGGSLEPCENHVNSYHTLQGKWAKKRCIDEVNSFHDFAITNLSLAKEFEVLAWSNDECIEAFKHKSLPWLGIMWHPEREVPFKTNDIELFFEHFGI